MYKTSKEKTDVSLLKKLADTASKDDDDDDKVPSPPKKLKESPKTKKYTSPSKTRNIDDFFDKKSPKKEPNDSIKKETNVISIKKEYDYKLKPDNPLPDIFLNLRLGFYPDYISFDEFEREEFERHWIAFGGEVDKSVRFKNVDFVVHKEHKITFKEMQKLKRRLGCDVKNINKNWLIKCINDRCLCDTSQFPVYVEPS